MFSIKTKGFDIFINGSDDNYRITGSVRSNLAKDRLRCLLKIVDVSYSFDGNGFIIKRMSKPVCRIMKRIILSSLLGSRYA